MANAEADAAGKETRTAHTSSFVGPVALITPCPCPFEGQLQRASGEECGHGHMDVTVIF